MESNDKKINTDEKIENNELEKISIKVKTIDSNEYIVNANKASLISDIKKELEEQKKENSQLKSDLNEFEIKLDAANDLISKLVDSKVSKKKFTR